MSKNGPRHGGHRNISFEMVMDTVADIMRPVLTKLDKGEDPTTEEWVRYFATCMPITRDIGDAMFKHFFPENKD